LDKQQWIVTGSAFALLLALFMFGRTKPLPKHNGEGAGPTSEHSESLDINAFILELKKGLKPESVARIDAWEKSVIRGDVKTQKIDVYARLAAFWKDSARQSIPYLWYTGEGAKLENSEKKLNFAAHSYLEELRGYQDPEIKRWMAVQAHDLFSHSLRIDPADDSAKIGLGSTYFFGGAGDVPPMEGIMKIRDVAEKDSTNMFAQFMLGYGSMVSGQFAKATERLSKVVEVQPGNKEAVFLLAESYERVGDKKQAAKWFRVGRTMVDNPDVIRAIDEKLKTLE
jgi:tetratricopeptide (TPR) repeat protein